MTSNNPRDTDVPYLDNLHVFISACFSLVERLIVITLIRPLCILLLSLFGSLSDQEERSCHLHGPNVSVSSSHLHAFSSLQQASLRTQRLHSFETYLSPRPQIGLLHLLYPLSYLFSGVSHVQNLTK